MIKNLAENDRPRERLIRKGVSSLSDIELLAILLGSGTKALDVLKLSENILKKHPMKELKNLSYEEMIQISGIKQAKACQLIAAFELARRAVSMENPKMILDTPNKIYQQVYADFYLAEQELLVVLLVDCKLHLIKKKIYYEDSTHQVAIPVRKLVREAVICQAYGVILCHNHPNGSCEPSLMDVQSTKHIFYLLDEMEIHLLDHLVVHGNSYYSFLEHGIFETFHPYSEVGDHNEENWFESDGSFDSSE